ncbi:hypothetical protein [Reichenbachiella sp. MALMAid0571]|uniref:PGAP1-like alpha/beta domain-containing protein n=1 Tax=Reichenbachiella sp. MALMAid0571 TaxID=3143939 RepID=UPI0032DE8C7A
MFKNPFKKERKIIIGIHGLSNKPPRKLLAKWWRKSIMDGLYRHQHFRTFFRFRMVYWADVIYEKPEDPTIKDSKHPRYIDEPYVPMQSFQRPSKGSWGKKLFDKFETIIDGIFLSKNSFINLNYFADLVIRRKYKDLDIYYREDLLTDEVEHESLAREIIRQRLKSMLLKNKGNKIMLIAHSMGSIIAYDVLFALQDEIEIDTFVTIGSPLGLPMVISKFFDEHSIAYTSKTRRKTPDNIKHWYNFADIDDGIAANDDLSDEFLPNKHGVLPTDKNIYNDYKNWTTENAHKSYGYLRTPEMSKVVYEFLLKLPFWKKYKL